MKVQRIYNFRERTEFCSRAALREFFKQQTGRPYPTGDVEIDDEAAMRFVRECDDPITHNDP